MTGWTWDQVPDQLDLPRVELLREQWQHNPPLAVTMRAAAEALGVEFNSSKLPADSSSGLASGATFDPMVAMEELGLVEGPVYVPPRVGMPLGDEPAQA